MKGVNKVIILGNLGQDPELKYMPNGDAVVNISVATSESWKDKNTGQQQEKTEWHRVVAFKRLAEIIGEYLHKGSKVYIEGKLQTRKWQDQDGNDRYSTEIIAREMQMLDSRAGAAGGDNGFSNKPKPQQQPSGTGGGQFAASNQAQAPAPAQQPAQPDFDDDIPF